MSEYNSEYNGEESQQYLNRQRRLEQLIEEKMHLLKVTQRDVSSMEDVAARNATDGQIRKLVEQLSYKEYAGLRKLLGDSLIFDENKLFTRAMQENLRSLSLISKRILLYVKRKGVKIIIGEGAVTDLVPDYNFTDSGLRRRGLELNEVAGVYIPDRKLVVAPYRDMECHGGLCSIWESVVMHEVGHAVDDLVCLNCFQSVKDAHKRLWNKISFYEQQDGPGDYEGVQEFLAESFSAYFEEKRQYFESSKQHFIKKYDEEWYNFIDGVVKNPQETLEINPSSYLNKDLW